MMHLFQFSQNAVFIFQIFDFFGITFNNIFSSQHIHSKKSIHEISQLMTLRFLPTLLATVEIARSIYIYIHVNIERCNICGPKTATDREYRIDHVKILFESDWPQRSDAIASSGRPEIL